MIGPALEKDFIVGKCNADAPAEHRFLSVHQSRVGVAGRQFRKSFCYLAAAFMVFGCLVQAKLGLDDRRVPGVPLVQAADQLLRFVEPVIANQVVGVVDFVSQLGSKSFGDRRWVSRLLIFATASVQFLLPDPFASLACFGHGSILSWHEAEPTRTRRDQVSFNTIACELSLYSGSARSLLIVKRI